MILSRPGKVKQLMASDSRNLQCPLKPDVSLLPGHMEMWLLLHCHVHSSRRASLKELYFFHSLTSSVLLHTFLEFIWLGRESRLFSSCIAPIKILVQILRVVMLNFFSNFQPECFQSQFIPICSCVSMAFSLSSCFPCLVFTSLKCLQKMGTKTDGYRLACNLY